MAELSPLFILLLFLTKQFLKPARMKREEHNYQ